MNSCIYQGSVRHRRFSPARLEFRYSLFLMYLDLDELPSLFRDRWLWSADDFNVAWFRRRDHMGDPDVPLKQAVCNLVEQQTGVRPEGRVCLLTHLRYFGYCFNPVSFYFCFDRSGQTVRTIVAEVNNTPWGEQHCYVLDESRNMPAGKHNRYGLQKAFHVSPFMPMDVIYDWRFTQPQDRLAVHMENYRGGHKFFDATMSLHRTALNPRTLSNVLMKYPLMTVKVIAAIYYQAARLWWRKVPFYAHPKKQKREHRPGEYCP